MATLPKPAPTSVQRDVDARKAAARRTGQATPIGRRAVGKIKVRATQTGYYGHTRRRAGDVFTIESEQEFSHRWMEHVDPRTPESITTANHAIRQAHDEILLGKMQEGMHVGPDSVPANLPTGDRNPLGDPLGDD